MKSMPSTNRARLILHRWGDWDDMRAMNHHAQVIDAG